MTVSVVPLETDEEVLWSGRPRLATVLPEAAVGLLLVVAAVALATVLDEPLLVLLVPVGLALPVWKFLAVTHTEFLITGRALYRKTGVLSRNVRRIGLDRVQNSSFRQGIRGSLLGYGTVVVEAAGGGELGFDDVMGPREVRSLVDRRADVDRVPGTVTQWEAILEEVRALGAALAED